MWNDNRWNETVTGRNMEFNSSVDMNVSSSGNMTSNMSSPFCPGIEDFSTGYRWVSIAPPTPPPPCSRIRTVSLVLSQVSWLEDMRWKGGTDPCILGSV